MAACVDSEGSSNAAELAVPILATSRITLRPIRQSDYDFLYTLSLSPEATFRWRYRGMTPSPEEFVRNLWHNVTAQFVVVDAARDIAVGHVVAFDASHRDHWVHLGAIGSPSTAGSGAMVEAMGLFVDYLFLNWSFNRLYISAIEFNYEQFRSGLGPVFCEEGRLSAHCFYDGKYWDMVLLALFRSEWRGDWRQVLGSISGSTESGAEISDIARDELEVDAEEKPAIGIEEFIDSLKESIIIDSDSEIGPDDHLVRDLTFDSLQVIVALDFISSLAGRRELPPVVGGEDEVPSTVRDLYLMYLTLLQSPDEDALTRVGE